MIISLTGFMGCGKSSVGRELSELLCCGFADLDTLIEERAGCSVAEIFERYGEKEFRRLEKETLTYLIGTNGRGLEIPKPPAPTGHPLAGGGMSSPPSSPLALLSPTEHETSNHTDSDIILALGGGAVMTRECEDMVHKETFCVYLRASADTLVTRLANETEGRPLLAGDLRPRILDLMSQRADTYERTAHFIVDTDGKTVGQIAQVIKSCILSEEKGLPKEETV